MTIDCAYLAGIQDGAGEESLPGRRCCLWRRLAMSIAVALQFAAASAFAGTLPTFESDEAADQWLRKASPFYGRMAGGIEAKGELRFRSFNDCPLGIVHYEGNKKTVGLNDALQGAGRVSVLIFEVTNAYQAKKHLAIDLAAGSGEIADAAEFGLLHELVEYDGLRLHRVVLEELDKTVGGIPREMLHWIGPDLTLSTYELPLAYDFIKMQKANGHTTHYHEWFPKQVEQGGRIKDK